MQPTPVEKILQGIEFYTGVSTSQQFKYFTSLFLIAWFLKRVLVAQLYLTLFDTMDVDGILQARTLEWVAIPFSR